MPSSQNLRLFNLRPIPVLRAHLLHEVIDGRGAAVHVRDIGQAAPGPDTAFACGEGQSCGWVPLPAARHATSFWKPFAPRKLRNREPQPPSAPPAAAFWGQKPAHDKKAPAHGDYKRGQANSAGSSSTGEGVFGAPQRPGLLLLLLLFPPQALLPVGTCSTICIRAPCEHEGEEMLEAGFLQDYFFFFS